MKKDSKTITYTVTEKRSFEYFKPHSISLLIHNILLNLFVAMVLGFMTIISIPYDVLGWQYYCLTAFVQGMFVFIIVEEWINGRNYKEAKKIIKEYNLKEKDYD